MPCTLRRFIPNNKIIYTLNVHEEFQDHAALKKGYLNRTRLFRRRAFQTGKRRDGKAVVLGEP